MKLTGLDQVNKELEKLTFRHRQNIERKAARLAMNAAKADLKAEWKNTPVGDKSKPVRVGIRRNAAKALTVKVGSKRGSVGFHTYGRIYLNYKKKNAGRARMAHLLEFSHKTGGGGEVRGKHPTKQVYLANRNQYRNLYMRAVLAWITSPKMTQTEAKRALI